MNRLRWTILIAHVLLGLVFLLGAGYALVNSKPNGAAFSGLIAALALMNAWLYWRRIQNDGNGPIFKFRK